jgi:phosphopentomutase
MKKRIVLIVLDSVGIGAMNDAAHYGDEGSNTLLHVYENIKGFSLPNLEKLGITHIKGLEKIRNIETSPVGAFARLEELSPGKDTTTGHWEISGIVLDHPFPTYPEGFPDDILSRFEKEIGRGWLGNKAASGTAIIEELGEEHIATGKVIVYTSADSVFQIAAHEDIVPLEELYDICSKARGILKGKHGVGRVIARPFKGISGEFMRTENRKDFSLEPTEKTMLDYISDKDMDVIAIGKIEDIFNGKGITQAIHTKNNYSGIDATINEIKKESNGIIFTNLVDFDMLYGHRNNIEGYGHALKEFDIRLPDIMSSLKETDILMITADHGCDPSTSSTDHSREYVPLLIYGCDISPSDLGTFTGFNTIAKTVLDFLGINNDIKNSSLKNMIFRG